MSRHTGNHSSNICWIIFLINASVCTCLIIYWELIPMVKSIYNLPRKVLTIRFHQESMRISSSWYSRQHDTLITVSFLFLQLNMFIPSWRICISSSMTSSSRILSCHTFTWFNSPYYSDLPLIVTSLERSSLIISCYVTSQFHITSHYFIFIIAYVITRYFLLLYLFVCLCFPSLECKLHENRNFICLFQHLSPVNVCLIVEHQVL